MWEQKLNQTACTVEPTKYLLTLITRSLRILILLNLLDTTLKRPLDMTWDCWSCSRQTTECFELKLLTIL